MSDKYRVTAGSKFRGDFTNMQEAINLRDNLHLDGFRDAAVEVLEDFWCASCGDPMECGSWGACLNYGKP